MLYEIGLGIVCALAGAGIGAVTVALLAARERDSLLEDLEHANDSRAQLRSALHGCDWALGAMQSAIADCSNQPAPVVGQVFEALRAVPEIAHALGRWPARAEQCADPAAVERTRKLLNP